MAGKKAEWLGMDEIFKNHRDEIKRFADCYFLFSGVAGKCYNCQVQDICIGINVDNGHEPPEDFKTYYKWGF